MSTNHNRRILWVWPAIKRNWVLIDWEIIWEVSIQNIHWDGP